MAKVFGESKGLELRYFKNNSKNETYGVELEGGLGVAIEPGDMVAITDNEIFVLSQSNVWESMDFIEIDKKKMKESIKNVGKQVVGSQDYNQFSDMLSKTDEDILNSANELKSLSKIKRLKEECEKANKGYLLIKELQRIIDEFGKK